MTDTTRPGAWVLYFRDGIAEVHASYEAFDNGLEITDIEDGEYDHVFDADGGRFRWTVDPITSRRQAWLWKYFGAGRAFHCDYEPPTPDSRAELEQLLRAVLHVGAAEGVTLDRLVARAADRWGHGL